MKLLALLLLCFSAHAEPMCGLLNPNATILTGYSPSGQWLVAYSITEAPDAPEGQPKAKADFLCYLVGRTTSFATLGTRLQSVKTSPDQKSAFDASWAQYVITPLTDPKMAAVRADFCADMAVRLRPWTLKECK